DRRGGVGRAVGAVLRPAAGVRPVPGRAARPWRRRFGAGRRGRVPAPPGGVMPEIAVNGTRLYYQQSGDGPDVVLVHAVTSNQAIWVFSGLIDSLAADFRVTSYDLRGHGASDRPPTGYTSAVMADDLIGLHAALGLGPAYLVGHSFGGVVG